LNITLDKQSTTDGLIKIKLSESDYQPKVEEKVKDYAKKAQIKGFRQGKVPAGVIRKMYGKSILTEEVNHLISHGISDYIKENKISVLGDPLPNEEKARLIDWDIQKDFEFEFQIGMVEDFKINLTPQLSITRLLIEVDQKVIDETLSDIRGRYGKTEYPELSSTNDSLYGDISLAGSADTKGSFINISKVNSTEQSRFIGKKAEDLIEFDVRKAFSSNEEIARALNLNEEEAKNASGVYTFKVTSVSSVTPAELNQELFDKVFGPGTVSDEEAFMKKISETIADNYERESNHLLEHELQHLLVDHTPVVMPDTFLKTWLKATSQGQVNDDVLEKEFHLYKESLKWDLIKNRIAEDFSLKVESDDVREKAKHVIAEQFGGQAIIEQLGDKMNEIANNWLSGKDGKGENFMRIYNQLRQDKIMLAVKEKISVVDKQVSLEEFKNNVAKHNH